MEVFLFLSEHEPQQGIVKPIVYVEMLLQRRCMPHLLPDWIRQAMFILLVFHGQSCHLFSRTKSDTDESSQEGTGDEFHIDLPYQRGFGVLG